MISASQSGPSSRATGVASPAWPPISQPMPVGTSKTALNRPVFSNFRLTNWKIEVRDAAAKAKASVISPSEQRYPSSSVRVTPIRVAIGVEMQAAQALQDRRVAIRQAGQFIDRSTELGRRPAGVVTEIFDERQARVDPQSALALSRQLAAVSLPLRERVERHMVA